jgi:hypothetical protein
MKIMFFYFLKLILLTSSIKTIKNTQKNSKKKSRKSVSSAKKHTTPKIRCVKSLIKSFHGGKKLPWISQHEMIKVSPGRCQPVWFSCPLTTQSKKVRRSIPMILFYYIQIQTNQYYLSIYSWNRH